MYFHSKIKQKKKLWDSHVLGGLDGTGLESLDSAVTDSMNDGRFVGGILLGIMTIRYSDMKGETKVNKKGLFTAHAFFISIQSRPSK